MFYYVRGVMENLWPAATQCRAPREAIPFAIAVVFLALATCIHARAIPRAKAGQRDEREKTRGREAKYNVIVYLENLFEKRSSIRFVLLLAGVLMEFLNISYVAGTFASISTRFYSASNRRHGDITSDHFSPWESLWQRPGEANRDESNFSKRRCNYSVPTEE